MSLPFMPVRMFELALCDYTGAKHAVAVNSCTSALLLACAWHLRDRERGVFPISIPKRTYVSVPMSIIHAGGRVAFRDEPWLGAYQLKPFPIWDSARRFTGGMFEEGQMQCVSFHAAKILGDTQGGAILHDNDEADEWFRRARFDGRTEGVPPAKDFFRMVGWHSYMSVDVAARLHLKLHFLPKHNEDLPNDAYPDLSVFEVFR